MILLLAWLWLMAAVAAGRTLLRVFAVHPRGQLESLLLSFQMTKRLLAEELSEQGKSQ